MKLPKFVQVGPFRYEVSTEQRVSSGLAAEFNYEELTIRISETCQPGTRSATLLHEIIHAVDKVFSADLKERQVEVLAHGLAQALGSMGAWPEEFE